MTEILPEKRPTLATLEIARVKLFRLAPLVAVSFVSSAYADLYEGVVVSSVAPALVAREDREDREDNALHTPVMPAVSPVMAPSGKKSSLVSPDGTSNGNGGVDTCRFMSHPGGRHRLRTHAPQPAHRTVSAPR